jgi:hypothetical protein
LTKPGEVATSVGFMANKERLNIALSRAQKVFIVVGNLTLRGEGFVKSLGTNSNHKKVLRALLVDVRQKKHVLTWLDKRVVTEVVPEPGVSITAISDLPCLLINLATQFQSSTGMPWRLTTSMKCHLQLGMLPREASFRMSRCLRASLFPWRSSK